MSNFSFFHSVFKRLVRLVKTRACLGKGEAQSVAKVYFFYFLAGLDTANAVYRRFFDPAGGKIGISAHMGGLLAGNGVMLLSAFNNYYTTKFQTDQDWV